MSAETAGWWPVILKTGELHPRGTIAIPANGFPSRPPAGGVEEAGGVAEAHLVPMTGSRHAKHRAAAITAEGTVLYTI